MSNMTLNQTPEQSLGATAAIAAASYTPAAVSEAALAQESVAAQAAIRSRKRLIIALRLAVLVIVLGGWELSARMKWIDPFFYSMPSMIWNQIVEWMRDGTSQGPLWQQVLVTLEETVIGFLIGSIAGVICSISSVPNIPASPAWGFKPATATRGSAIPSSLQDSSANSITFSTLACLTRLQASRSET